MLSIPKPHKGSDEAPKLLLKQWCIVDKDYSSMGDFPRSPFPEKEGLFSGHVGDKGETALLRGEAC